MEEGLTQGRSLPLRRVIIRAETSNVGALDLERFSSFFTYIITIFLNHLNYSVFPAGASLLAGQGRHFCNNLLSSPCPSGEQTVPQGARSKMEEGLALTFDPRESAAWSMPLLCTAASRRQSRRASAGGDARGLTDASPGRVMRSFCS